MPALPSSWSPPTDSRARSGSPSPCRPVTGIFSAARIPTGNGSSKVTLSPGPAAAGTYSVVITATGGGKTHTATLSWTIVGAVQTVFVIVMENHNWSSIKGNPSAPYINNTLLATGAHAENYVNVPRIHPSEPNYLWLEAGTNFLVTNDNNPSSNHQSTTQHLVTQLQAAGIHWKSYHDGISGTSCPLTSSGLYAPKHNPMIYFDDITNSNSSTSQTCITHVRPYTELASDLQNHTVARYNFITPNPCNDMHNSSGLRDERFGAQWRHLAEQRSAQDFGVAGVPGRRCPIHHVGRERGWRPSDRAVGVVAEGQAAGLLEQPRVQPQLDTANGAGAVWRHAAAW